MICSWPIPDWSRAKGKLRNFCEEGVGLIRERFDLVDWAQRCVRAGAQLALRVGLAEVVAMLSKKRGSGKWAQVALFTAMVYTTVLDLKLELERRRPAGWAVRLRRLVLPAALASLMLHEGAAWDQLQDLCTRDAPPP